MFSNAPKAIVRVTAFCEKTMDMLVMSDYYYDDELKAKFACGVLGILQGGLSRRDYNSDLRHEDLNYTHTIMSGIRLIKREHNIDLSNIVLVNEYFANFARISIEELENSWSIVVEAYVEIKNKYLS